MKRLLQISLLISMLLISLTACASSAREMSMEAPAMTYDSAPVDSLAYEDSETIYEERSTSFNANAATLERIVIRNADLSIVVDDPETAVQQIAEFASQYGGFVVSSELYKTTYGVSDVEITRGSIALRVLSDNLDDALDDIKELAIEIESENISGEDVTDRYTDLNSRLRNLEAAEERLLAIMEGATETEDVLSIFENLRQVQEEIEVLRGQIKYLEESARLSHIYVSLTPDEVAQPLQIGSWRPEGTAKQAVEALVGALKFIGDTLIWMVICIVPVGLILGVPGYFVVRALLRKRQAKKTKNGSETLADK